MSDYLKVIKTIKKLPGAKEGNHAPWATNENASDEILNSMLTEATKILPVTENFIDNDYEPDEEAGIDSIIRTSK